MFQSRNVYPEVVISYPIFRHKSTYVGRTILFPASPSRDQDSFIPGVQLLKPVRTGDGKVEFSHGILDIPAPATKIILEKYNLKWEKGPIDTELCTPTGASLLAALIDKNKKNHTGEFKVLGEGSSRGSKILPIPPLKIYLV